MRLNSQTQEFTRALQRQKLSMSEMLKNRNVMKAAYNEQVRMQAMTIAQMRDLGNGKHMVDVTVPSAAIASWDNLRLKAAWAGAALGSASQQMINWGKNTQWAGRQLTVGFTMPVAAAAAGMGILAYQADQQLTRIAKVYDTQTKAIAGDTASQARQQQELDNLRSAGMATSADAAKKYGAAMKDTLSVQAELAAIGLSGNELQQSTTQVMRAATLGELDHAEAIRAVNTMQTVFNQTIGEQQGTWDYINAIENATSLTAQDFVEAMPIAAASVKNLGGDIKDLGVMMVAFKQNGINANEGANALKSALNRIMNPGKEVQKVFKDLTGKSITDLTKSTNGELIPTFLKIQEATKNLGNMERQQVFGKLFGTYQVARLTALTDGLARMGDETTQVYRAVEVGAQTATENASIAQAELDRQAESASGKFKRALESLKVELSEMGQPFLEIGATIMSGVTDIVGAFNALPNSVKKVALIGAALVAIAGPAIMLTGLTANLFGQFAKGIGTVITLASRTGILTKEQLAANKVAEWARQVQSNQTTSTQALTSQVELLTQSLREAATAQLEYINASRAASGQAPVSVPRSGAPAEKEKVRREARSQAETQTAVMFGDKTVDGAKDVEQSTGKVRKNMTLAAADAAVFGGAMAASMISSNETVDNLANWAMIMAGLAPVLGGLITFARSGAVSTAAAKVSSSVSNAAAGMGAFTSRAKDAAKATGGVSGAAKAAGGAIKAGAVGFASMLGPVGMISVALAAAAAAGYLLYKHMRAAGEEAKKTYEDVEGLGKIFDFTPTDTSTIDESGKAVKASVDYVKQFREEYAGVVKDIQGANTDQQKFNLAYIQGMKALNSGASADQARQVVRTALAAAEGEAEGKRIAIRFSASLDFDNADIRLQQAARSTGEMFSKGMQEALNKNGVSSVFESVIQGRGEATKEGKVIGESAGESYARAFGEAVKSGNQQTRAEVTDSMIESVGKLSEKMRTMSESGDQFNFDRQLDYLQSFVRGMAIQAGKTEEQADDIAMNFRKAAIETKGAINPLKLMEEVGMDISGQSRLQLLLELQKQQAMGINVGYSKAELATRIKETKAAVIAAEAAAKNTKGKKDGAAAQMDAAESAEAEAEAQEKISTAMERRLQMQRDAVSASMDDLAGQMTDDFEARHNRAMDSLEAAGEARLDRFDKKRDQGEEKMERRAERMEKRHENQDKRFDTRWDKRIDSVSNFYDKRVEAVQKAIDAEQTAEELRQRIFEAEKTRIQRLNEMMNRDVDFNVALNSGNLDEAARIRNDAQSASDTWMIEDAQGSQASASERRVTGLEAKKDVYEKEKETRIKQLEAVKQKRREVLDDQQEREKNALEASKKRYAAETEARRKAIQAQLDATKRGAQLEYDARKRSFDRAMAALRSFVPQNEAQLAAHIARVGRQYGTFGGILQTRGNQWGQFVGNSLTHHIRIATNELRSDVNWEAIGKAAAQDMTYGAFGISLGKFNKLLGLGNVDKNGNPKAQGKGGTPVSNRPRTGSGAPTGNTSRHSGGTNVRYSGRTGFPAGAGLFKQEKLTNIRNDEYVVDHRTHAALGTDYFDNLKKSVRTSNGPSNHDANTGGAGPMGFAGVAGAMLGHVIKGMAGTFVKAAGYGEQGTATPGNYTTARAGKYGDERFDAEQLKNAATIASVGRGMGMSARDIKIGLMTAMVESNLRNVNYGDRDSLGLFQQRPSMGWGTPEQVTDPLYSSRKFFNVLKGVSDRDKMSMGEAAQAVQRSAFPGRYSGKRNEAEAIYAAMRFITKDNQGKGLQIGFGPGLNGAGGDGGMNYTGGKGGWHLPISGRKIGNTHGGGAGSDIGVPGNTPVRSVYDGKVLISKDLLGNQRGGYRSYGRYIMMGHNVKGKSAYSLYAHLNKRGVRAGQMVPGGSVIGLSGNTGNTHGPTGNHLHFEMGWGNKANTGSYPGSFVKKYGGLPAMRKGGETRYEGPHYLHKNEVVLPAALSSQFKKNVTDGSGFASSGDTNYNVNVYAAEGQDAKEIADAVVKELDKRESRYTGKKRVRRGS